MSFQRLPNFRDIATGIPFVKAGLLYRSAAPDDATPSDRARLTNDYHLKTIIDLRSETEHIEAKKKSSASQVPPAPDPGEMTAPKTLPSDARVPGVEYKFINFNGKAYSNALLWQLSYWNLAKLITKYSIGHRTQAISILGENVMSQRGLVGLAIDSLTHCKAEIKTVFDILADETQYPVLVHCTQGKDRTGLTILLVLLLLGVDIGSIEKDYLLSEEELRPDREERLKAVRSIGLTDEFAGCPTDWVEKVDEWIREQNGGVSVYLKSCGVSDEQMGIIVRILRN